MQHDMSSDLYGLDILIALDDTDDNSITALVAECAPLPQCPGSFWHQSVSVE